MSISTEEKDRYLRETAIVLAREGFQTGKTDTGKLRVLLDGAPLCEVTESGGIAYRNKDIDEPERIAAKDKVYEIVRNTAEYMRQMETAPVLKADSLEDGYKVRPISMALCWLEFRVNTESTSSHGIGPMGAQVYVMATISWRTIYCCRIFPY